MIKNSPPRANPQPVSRCCAPTCSNSSENTSGVSFFRFPKDEERCKKWVANCGRLDLQDKPAEKLFANYRLCSTHFTKESFSSTYRNRLVWNAVPTLFKHGDKVVSKGTGKRKLLPHGSQQRFRRFFGFASKRRTSVQLRANTGVPPMAPSPQKSAVETVTTVATDEDLPEKQAEQGEEGPRLPVYIEDHMYAVPTVHLPLENSRKAPQDPVALKAAMEAVEAALPLLQLSQQPPLHHTQGTTVAGGQTITYVTVPASSSSATGSGVGGSGAQPTIPPGTTFTVTTMQEPTSTEVTIYPSSYPDDSLDEEYIDEPYDDPSPSHRGRLIKARKGPRLMQDFLLPHLDSGTFGERLQWVDRANGIFQIGWYHKNAAQWTNDDCVVFLEWDRLKKRPVAESPHYWMEAKQRFRAALGKVSYGWTPPDNEQFKNVKLRRIKWTDDMQPPLEGHWKPWNAATTMVPAGRVHRPTISRIERLVAPEPAVEEDEEEEDDDADCGINGGPAVCHQCGYVTRNLRVFLRHRMMHRDVRAFCCRYCPQRFCLPESLFLHLQVHTEKHPYACSSCGVRTRLLLQLWRHELRSLAQRLCLCHRCGLICHIRENLRQHLLKVHKVSVSSAFCTKPFQVCPGPSTPTRKTKTKPSQAAAAAKKTTQPGGKAGVNKEPARATGKPKGKPTAAKSRVDKAGQVAKPKSAKPGRKKQRQAQPAANKLKPVATKAKKPARGGKVPKLKPSKPVAAAVVRPKRSADGKLSSTMAPSAKRLKRDQDETKVSCIVVTSSNGDSNQMSDVQHDESESEVVTSGAVPSEHDICVGGSVHTARKSVPNTTSAVATIMAYQMPSGELSLSMPVPAMATSLEQGRRRTQRVRTPKRKIDA
ncbi:uncharacterized protein LOC144107697 isoform X1 [Amblyomma americanum]